MSLCLFMARFPQEVIRQLLEKPERLQEREAHAVKFWGAVGGTIVHSYFVRHGEFNFMIIVDFPDMESAHAAMLVGAASGAVPDGSLQVYHLATMDEARAALVRAGANGQIVYPMRTHASDETPG